MLAKRSTAKSRSQKGLIEREFVMPKPHPKNAAGSFYVAHEECVVCGCCEDTAPGLFLMDELSSFVARQPENPAELERMLEAARSCITDCIRYRGAEITILRRLAENGLGPACDQPPPADARPINRTHVRFSAPAWRTAQEAASNLAAHLGQDPHMKVKPGSTDVSFAWYEDQFHTTWISAVERTGVWLARHGRSGDLGRSVSRCLHGWLTGAPEVTEVTWFTANQWGNRDQGQDRPY